MRPIVHIGVHKTATSWFQRHVWPAVDSHLLVDRRDARRVLLGSDAFGFEPDAAREALGLAGDAKPAILCEEDLSGVLHIGLASGFVARETAARLHALLPDAQILILVRAQASAAVSWYLQYLREGGTKSARDYLFPEGCRNYGRERPFKQPRFHWSQLDWAKLVRHYDSVFGRASVHVLPYESLADDAAAAIGDIGGKLGVALPAPCGGRVNMGYRRRLIPLLRAANLFTRRSVTDKATLLHIPYWYPARKAMFERLNRAALFGRPPGAADLLGEDIIEWIGQHFTASNAWLERRMDRDLSPHGYRTRHRDGPAASPPRRAIGAWIAN